jgi:hypothetical protein
VTLAFNCFRGLIETVFVDSVGVEVAFGLFAVTATSAIDGLVAGVIESSLSGVDLRLAIRLGTLRRIPDGDPLGIALEPASHNWFLLFARFRYCGRACCAFAFIPAQLFPRGPLTNELEARAQISRCASGAEQA